MALQASSKRVRITSVPVPKSQRHVPLYERINKTVIWKASADETLLFTQGFRWGGPNETHGYVEIKHGTGGLQLDFEDQWNTIKVVHSIEFPNLKNAKSMAIFKSELPTIRAMNATLAANNRKDPLERDRTTTTTKCMIDPTDKKWMSTTLKCETNVHVRAPSDDRTIQYLEKAMDINSAALYDLRKMSKIYRGLEK